MMRVECLLKGVGVRYGRKTRRHGTRLHPFFFFFFCFKKKTKKNEDVEITEIKKEKELASTTIRSFLPVACTFKSKFSSFLMIVMFMWMYTLIDEVMAV